MDRASKENMLRSLNAANVEIPHSASLSQIRTLYQQVVGAVTNGTPDSVITVAPDATATSGATTSVTTSDATTSGATTSATSVAMTSANTGATTSASTAATIPTNTYATLETVTIAVTDTVPAVQPHSVREDALNVVAANANDASPSEPSVITEVNTNLTRARASTANNDLLVELERLRMQKEICELRQEINNLSRSDSVQPVKIDISTIESMVCEYTGETQYDVRKWLHDLEDAFHVLQFDERAKLISCRRLLKGTAKIFLRTVSVSRYEELKQKLIEEFGRNYTLKDVYAQLKNHRLAPNGNLKKYVLEMQEIATQANVPDSDLIDCIIDGIGDQTNNASILYNANNMREFKLLLERYEKRRGKTTPVRNSTNTTAAHTSATLRQPTNVSNKTSSANPEAATIRCFNCSKFGHYQSQCPQPRRPEGSCFRCGQTSHVYRDCPNRPRPMQSVAAIEPNFQEHAVDAEKFDSIQMVSVSFKTELDKCADRVNLNSLFDSGSPKSFVSSEYVPAKYLEKLTPTKYYTLGKQQLLSYGKVRCLISHSNVTLEHDFFILPSDWMITPVIVGRDLLQKFNIHLYKIKQKKYSKNSLIELNNVKRKTNKEFELISTLASFGLLNVKSVDSSFKYKKINPSPPMPSVENVSMVTTEALFSNILPKCRVVHHDEDIAIQVSPICEKVAEININPCLPPEAYKLLESKITEAYYELPDSEIVPDEYCMRISLTHDTPIFCRPRPLSYDERAKVRKIIDELIEKNIVRPSESPYASAIVLVPKKNGEVRKCVDYRPLNKITIRDNHPLPLIDNCLDHLGGKNFFTLIDLKNGFHQVKMHPDSTKYTSFVTPDGQYEYVRMPFGLKNAPAVFQRLINNILRKLIDNGNLVVYLDDIVIGTADFREHVETVGKVMRQLRKYGLEVRFDKCKFAYNEIDYLGFRANANGITPSGAHIEAIRKYPVPTNRHEVQQCYGLFSFFRRFVPSFSCIAHPLTQLLKKNTPFNFDHDCLNAFTTLRDLLVEAPVLSIYDPKLPTELHCDASAKGFGSVLLQQQNDGKFHPVAYFSKTTSAPESKLHAYELETLAIVYSLQRFHTYLHGIPFKIVTDCNSLAQTLSLKNSSAKIARWALKFENYQYTIQHRPGKSMSHVDALSRIELAAPTHKFEDRSVVSSINEVELDSLLELAQSRDPQIKILMSQLEERNVDGFHMQDGLVFRKSPSGVAQLYVPSEMIDNVIRQVHEKIGHLGVGKCCGQIKKHYWFPQMKNRVNNFIRNCLKCIVYSPPLRNKHHLYNIPKLPIPFDTIYVDHLGPLPSVNSRKKYLLVVIDAFTKFVKLYPATSTSSKEVCLALEEYFRYYSRPRRLISDRGTCFTSEEFTQFLQERNVVHVKVATASPQANGQVERVNRVLRPMLSKLSEPFEHGDWVKQLPLVEYALNNTIQSSTTKTPSVLLFGIEQRGEIVDDLTEYLQNKILPEPIDFQEIRQNASEAIIRSQEKNRDYFVKHSIPAEEFEVGDYVVIKAYPDTTSGKNKKLLPRFRGPYVVTKKLPHDRYVVKDIEGFQITQIPYNGILQSNKLRKWTLPVNDRIDDSDNETLIHLDIQPLYPSI